MAGSGASAFRASGTTSEPDGLSDARLDVLLAAFSDVRLLVVGDALLDEYLYGDAERISPEAPVPVVRVARETTVLGGAGNVVRNIVALGGQCEFCCVVGDDGPGDQLVRQLEGLGVATRGVVRTKLRATMRKTRVVAHRQQVVRVDRETVAPLEPGDAAALAAAVAAAAPSVSGLVLEDYGKGLLSLEVGTAIMREAARFELPVSVDPKHTLEPFVGAALVKPNLREAEAISGLSAADGLEAVARRLQRMVGGADVAITRGQDGMTIFEGDAPGVDVPTVIREVSDVQGAGDTIIAALALARHAGASLWEATVIANAAASVVIRKVGTATADREEVREAVPEVRRAARAALAGGARA